MLEVICGIGRTDEEIAAATRGVKSLLSFYGSTPSYKPVLDVEGWGSLQPELNARSKQGDWAGMAELITDEMAHTISVVGTPDTGGGGDPAPVRRHRRSRVPLLPRLPDHRRGHR